MKFIEPRPFADPEDAARKLMELAYAFEPIQDGRIYIEKINSQFLFELKPMPAKYSAGTGAKRLLRTRTALLDPTGEQALETVPRQAVVSV